MSKVVKIAIAAAALCGSALALSGAASAAGSPTGIWVDHTGRGAVEISNCGGNLCGKIVWIKDEGNKSACGMQVLGNVKPVSGGKWDNGWILDPEKNAKYDVEITPMGDNKLKVMGYAGMKFLSETFTWTRASADIKRCDMTAERTPDAPPPGNKPAPTPEPEPEPETTPPSAPSATPPPPPPRAAETPRPSEPEAKPGRTAKGKPRECTLDLTYVKITVPCDEADDD